MKLSAWSVELLGELVNRGPLSWYEFNGRAVNSLYALEKKGLVTVEVAAERRWRKEGVFAVTPKGVAAWEALRSA